jgi:CAAX protease family protein
MMMAIAILGNVTAVVLGVRAIRRLRSERKSSGEILTRLGFLPFRTREPVIGFVIGGFVFSLIFAAELYSGLLSVIRVEPIGGMVAVAFVTFLFAAFLEEVIFRSLFVTGMRSLGWTDRTAVALCGVLFGMVHLANPHVTLLSFLSACIGGVMYATAFVLTNRIWLSTGLHFAWNFFQATIFGFVVSGLEKGGIVHQRQAGEEWLTGGGYGPEGGIIGIGGRILVVLLVLLIFGRGKSDPLTARTS